MLIDFSDPGVQKLIRSFITLVVAYSIAFWVVRLINSLKISIKRKHQARKITYYIAGVVAAVVLIAIWLENTRSLATVVSVIGAGVALALHEALLNIAGWLLILSRRPFETGDRVEMGGVQGDVIDIRLFQTILLEIGKWVEADQSTGRVVHCPNSMVFKSPLYNYTRGFEFIWNEIKILVTFESNWKKAREIMLKFAVEEGEELQKIVEKKIDRMSKKYMIHYHKLTPIVYVRIADSGVELTLRYLTEARKRRSTQDRICQDILNAFELEPDIDFAYPTYRIYCREKEQGTS